MSSFRLLRNAPNPFRTTRIEYELSEAVAGVRLRVFDVNGRLVRTLAEGTAEAGLNTAVWDGTDDRGHQVASGFYFYRLDAPNFTETRRMLLVK